MAQNSIKVVLATGIFVPEVGGPAIHVRKIAEALVIAGFKPVVIAYGDNPANDEFSFPVRRASRRWPKALRWLVYFFLVLSEAWRAKIIYAFDVSAAGVPAFITAKILGKKFVIRIGGDPIWERIVEHGKRFISLDEYYDQRLYLIDRPGLYRLIKFIVSHSDRIVLYNNLFKEFYIKYFGAKRERVTVVANPIYVRGTASLELSADPIILFAGRFVAYKNLPLVIRAFERFRSEAGRGRLLLVGHGPDQSKLETQIANSEAKSVIDLRPPLPQEQLFKLINESALAIGPALSEFNPNFILESLSFGKPVVLSRGHGLSVALPEEFLFNPYNEDELLSRFRKLLSPEFYPDAVKTVAALPRSQTWEQVTQVHVDLLKNLSLKP
jgi:glycosyltransferase involved in cell wall biosynthesis